MRDMEKIWHHTLYTELRIFPEEHPTLLSEPPLDQKKNKMTTTQIFFETFSVPSFYVAMAPVLALYSSGGTTGIVLSSGNAFTYTVPIYEGCALEHGINRLSQGGQTCTEWLIKNIGQVDLSLSKGVAKNIKEKLCYVALNYEEEVSEYTKSDTKFKNYELPDGKIITVKDQRFLCPEPLFKPHLIGSKDSGIHDLIINSITKSDIDLRKELQFIIYILSHGNIFITGGNSMFSGLPERL